MTDHLSKEHIVKGADPTPIPEYAYPTPEQLWMRLLELPWGQRRQMLVRFLEDAEAQQQCFLRHGNFEEMRAQSINNQVALAEINLKLMSLDQIDPTEQGEMAKVMHSALVAMLTDLRKKLLGDHQQDAG